jgi:hypothetical protein
MASLLEDLRLAIVRRRGVWSVGDRRWRRDRVGAGMEGEVEDRATRKARMVARTAETELETLVSWGDLREFSTAIRALLRCPGLMRDSHMCCSGVAAVSWTC